MRIKAPKLTSFAAPTAPKEPLRGSSGASPPSGGRAPLSGIALWPLALVAGLLPALAALLAFGLAVHHGLAPACNPFVEGCTSISRAARHGLPNHLFRALVLPAAVLQALVWLLQARALVQAAPAAAGRSAALLAALGAAAGIALVLYGSFLGTEGEVYRWLRRYGIVIYFGGTCLAMLVLGRALQRLHGAGTLLLPRGPERVLLVLFGAIVLLGLGNTLAGLWADAALQDRIENATEWWGSLGLTLAFMVLAGLWRRWDLRGELRLRIG